MNEITLFLLQLIVVIIVSRSLGLLFKKIGQPAVIGEIMTGIILGPSLMGHFLPDLSAFLFPPNALQPLLVLSQIGLILFMWVVGMEVDLDVIRKKALPALVISHASIAIPMGLGVILSYYLYRDFAPPAIPFHVFALFIGISMSITAFPVLARIIRDRGLTGTKLGTIAITCAATDDITAWCLLAVLLSIVKGGNWGSSLRILALAIVYVCVMLYVIRPWLKKILMQRQSGNDPRSIDGSMLAVTFVLLLSSACCSELIGTHFLFGAFLAGIVMPSDRNLRSLLTSKIEDLALVILLPLFFVYTGLRTRIGLVDTPMLWLTCGLIIAVAVAGKLGGSAIAARMMGESVKDSLSIGALMNTRGLVELVVLNIGYDLGILSPRLFAMMVLMALFTTLMTSPVLDLVEKIKEPQHVSG